MWKLKWNVLCVRLCRVHAWIQDCHNDRAGRRPAASVFNIYEYHALLLRLMARTGCNVWEQGAIETSCVYLHLACSTASLEKSLKRKVLHHSRKSYPLLSTMEAEASRPFTVQTGAFLQAWCTPWQTDSLWSVAMQGI